MTRRRADSAGRQLATVFFIDMVGSTELAARFGDWRWRAFLGAYHAAVRKALRQHGGHEVDNAGDGFFAVFDQPARGIACACDLTDSLHAAGIEVRTGLHMGEVETVGAKLGGIAVHIGARVAAAANPGQVVVSGTIRDVVTGADFEFEDLGIHPLKGVPGDWRLFRVAWPDPEPLDERSLHAWEALPPAGMRAFRRLWPVVAVVVVLVGATTLTLALLGSRGQPRVAAVADTVAGVDASGVAFDTDYPVGQHPDGMVIAEGSAWIINSGSETLSRVDLATGAEAPAQSVGGAPDGIAFGGGSVWVSVSSTGRLLRYDVASGALEANVAVPDGVGSCAFWDNALWVVDQLDNQVVRIDSVTNAISTVAVGNDPVAVAAGPSGVWVANGVDSTLTRIDPTTDHVLGQPIALQDAPAAIAVGQGGVWVASAVGNSVTEIDPSSGQAVTSFHVDGEPIAIVVDGASIWVAESTAQQLVRIGAAPPNVLIATLSVEGHPEAVAELNGEAWVVVSG